MSCLVNIYGPHMCCVISAAEGEQALSRSDRTCGYVDKAWFFTDTFVVFQIKEEAI